MIIHEEIIKLNLRRKKYKYEIKYNDALSKSDRFNDLSKRYEDFLDSIYRNYSSYNLYRHEIIKYSNKIKKHEAKANHYKHLAEMYKKKTI